MPKLLACLSLFLCAACVLAANDESDDRNTEVAEFKTHFALPDYKSAKDWDARKAHLRQQILSAAGLLPMPDKTPLHAREVRRFEYEDYSIEAVLIETFPGYFVGGNLYRPVHHKGSSPGVLIPHGHWKHGRLEDQVIYSVPALGINLARQGYVAFAYDMVGYNDTRQTPHSFDSPEYALWSFTPMGLQLWNSIRALDYLQSLPDVDGDRIAATGASGGGSQTIFLTAVDDRVKVAAPVNMVSAYMQGGDPCEEAPNLRLETNNVEIAAAAAPRPMMMVSDTHDWTRHTPTEEFPAVRKIYELYGRGKNVENVHIDAAHNYNRQSREAVYKFFAEHLLMDVSTREFEEREFQLPREEDLLAFPKGDLPAGTGNFDQVFQSWQFVASQKIKNRSKNELRDILRTTLGADVESNTEASVNGRNIVLSRMGKHDHITGLWIPGSGAPVLIVDPAGASAALRSNLAHQVTESHRPILMIDPFRSDTKRVSRQRIDPYFLSYNRSDDAERVQDILTALAFLRSQTKGTPELVGMGNAGIWCLFAAAAAPSEVNLIADLNGFSGLDEDFMQRFFVPGIQQAGGLNVALRLAGNVRVTMPARRSASAGGFR